MRSARRSVSTTPTFGKNFSERFLTIFFCDGKATFSTVGFGFLVFFFLGFGDGAEVAFPSFPATVGGSAGAPLCKNCIVLFTVCMYVIEK